ncbi:hypothetical protein C5L30_001955 [Companilactobacillus farciminis]|uniref:HTH lysR-type domain-containing protein n=1 Tax=Companilactobacillus farciminis TaxID=1612 RepID=A0A4R5NCG4_9LACO|nr:LysR family transcriptional regulator [Companilactobacillus farciminis]ATO45473.1 hypothetical protein LF20184_01290 [Companilactobacillus farciminis KCTC 3681 = DSM 20184]KRK61606.1 YusT [Companilactobacillus farciminis KCTC 3681 = DSM 20184]TDG69822.1 hypothetical protein C5L30_001955 [Companilactobacillus farciminis]
MNTNTLEMFITIAQTGSISGAAEKLGYAQSNISTKLRQLEADLNTQLFYRNNRGITLTDAGKEFYTRAIKIISLTNDAIDQLKHPKNIQGNLKIGTLQTAASTFLPEILSKFHQQNPQVELSIATGTTLLSAKRVLNYELDGAIIGGRVSENKLATIPLMDEQLSLVAPNTEMDIDNAPLLVFPVGCAYRKTLESYLDSKQIMIHHPIEFNYLNAIVASVSAGLGISLLPTKVVQPYLDQGTIKEIPLPKDFSTLPVSFTYRKDHIMTQSFQEFIKILDKKD